MQNCADVVTLMHQNSKERTRMAQIEYIIGNEEILEHMPGIRAWKPFDERVITFCDELSRGLLKAKNCKTYPDLVTLAFWLRKSNLKTICKKYIDMSNHLGRGLAFHIAPGNVALSFAYSLATGLLTGNTNIIRLPSRRFEQADIFCEVLRGCLLKSPEMVHRVCLIKYPHEKSITDELSAMCHTRIIWGGDNTVNTIRQSPIQPRTTEITFANRFSIGLINSDKYISEYNPKKTAHDFFIDTYLTDQNACSSPRIIFWTGNRVEEAQKVFWDAVDDEIQEYQMEPVTTVDKLLTFCKYAAENPCNLAIGRDYRIMRINVGTLNDKILDNSGNSGFYYECIISDINEILPICNWNLQTLSYIGYDEEKLRELILSNAPDGVDRIVPVGHTMDFGFIWDGRDVIREMTREIL